MSKIESRKALDITRHMVAPGEKVRLDECDPNDTSGYSGGRTDAEEEVKMLKVRLEALHEKLYASHSHKLLIVLQGMDTAGKDSTIKMVFEGVNPQWVRVVGFKAPSSQELDHDFLWRVHMQVPVKGEIVIFNRSHYEDVLAVRVHKLVPKEIWESRYEEINDFERMLTEEGTSILKFYLNISEDEQKRRLEDRLKDPTKEWKFSINDLPERGFWPEYMKAYEAVFEKTSTKWAPWYIVPGNHRWIRDLIVSTVIVNTLENLNLSFPRLDPKLRSLSVE